MAMVMVKCPETGAAVFTGVETDAATFQRLPHASAQFQCPRCGANHTWTRADATLAENSPNRDGSR